MGKKLLIDATHAEETRVVVVDGNKVEEFDFETVHKRQLAGNIYLAKITRVEPSLQAAFVDYGGNRHGFLAFAEIHPDYYQIPVADRQALLAEERAMARADDDAGADDASGKDDGKEGDKPREAAGNGRKTRRRRGKSAKTAEAETASEDAPEAGSAPAPAPTGKQAEPAAETGAENPVASAPDQPDEAPDDTPVEVPADTPPATPADTPVEAPQEAPVEIPGETPSETPNTGAAADHNTPDGTEVDEATEADPQSTRPIAASAEGMDQRTYGSMDVVDLDDEKEGAATPDNDGKNAPQAPIDDEDEAKPFRAADRASERDDQIESVADEDVSDEVRPQRRQRARRYKIQEVIKVRQIMLVQVVKEERGNKGAALTTYLSLAGRYCVLMPNTARGGGISRKITNAADRKKLKEIAGEFDVPEGAGLIIRTAGANRTKTEIRRDYEYLFRLWEQIRELTLKSIAPAPIYEEGNLIKRSIRDLYNREIDEVLVEGEVGYRTAKNFMKMIMPSHAKNVKLYNEPMPLFARYQVESYLGSMFNPTVQLRSGGYIVIGVTEALVAIDVNSGKSTREGSIEDTALKTNLEAAEEVARQLRLRDLAGLIVIDFIDMEERKNNNAVEKRLKDALRSDRARIQVGRISGFGLLEMSRQRLRPGMIEATTRPCPACHGTGLIRSDNSLALQILRALEEEGTRNRSKEVLVKAPTEIVNYLFNAKREHVAQIELRYGMAIRLEADPSLISPDYAIEKFKTATRIVAAPSSQVVSLDARTMSDIDEALIESADESADESDTTPVVEPARTADDADASSQDDDTKSEGGKRKRRRRRRRKGGPSDDAPQEGSADSDDNGGEAQKPAPAKAEAEQPQAPGDAADETAEETTEDAPKPRKRRSRSRKKSTDGNDAKKDEDSAGQTQAGRPVAAASKAAAAAAPAEADSAPAGLAAEPVVEQVAQAQPEAASTMDEATAPDATLDAPSAKVAEPSPDAETGPRQTMPEDSVVAPAPKVDETPAVASEQPKDTAPTPEPAPEPDPEPAAPDPDPEPGSQDPAKPRRSGWWSRGR